MPTLDEVFQRNEELGRQPKWNGNGFSCDCGACRDTKRHLYVAAGDRVAITLSCKHGCPAEEAAKAMGYEIWELCKPDLVEHQGKLTIYPFTDEGGRRLYEEVRGPFKDKSKAKFRQPDTASPSGYRWNLEGARRVPFNLPELAAAKEGEIVLWPEGPKDVETCRKAGFTAFTGGQVTDAVKLIPKGVRIGILRDYDVPGLAQATKKLAALTGAGITAWKIELPGFVETLDHGKDVTDWVEEHGLPQLRALILEQFSPAPLPWEAPVSLLETALPPFPIEIFPSWLSNMVEAVAEATQTPLDVAGLLALAALSATVANRVEAHPFPGWHETLVVWVLAALDSGNLKSPVYNELMAPIVAYEAELIRLSKSEVAEDAFRRDTTEERIKNLKRQAVKGNEFERREALTEAGKLQAELDSHPKKVTPRLIADDITQERLAEMMSEQGGRMAIMSPEGNAFEIMVGRYTGGVCNLGIYKQAHSGDRVVMDRMGRPPVVIDHPALTMGVAVQPGVLVRFGESPQMREQGILARFLYCVPKSLLGHRDVKAAPVPTAVRQLYHTMMGKLLAIAPEQTAAGPAPHPLAFTREAFLAVEKFRAWLEPGLGSGAEYEEIRDWAGKAHGTLVRNASLLHLATQAGDESPWLAPVDGSAVGLAAILNFYLLEHARAAMRLVGRSGIYPPAQRILAYCKRHGKEAFSRRDLMRDLHLESESLDRAIEMLIEHGYLRPRARERNSTGRLPSPLFEVHPDLAKESRN